MFLGMCHGETQNVRTCGIIDSIARTMNKNLIKNIS